MEKYEQYKKQVYDCTMDLVKKGYIKGVGGNVSIRLVEDNAIAVTPSQTEYSEMSEQDICIVDFDLNVIAENGLKPSIETAMHVSVYRNRPDVNSVVHTHQEYASIFSLINTPIPALFDEVSLHTGPIADVVPYGLSGSPQLLENITGMLNNQCNCYILQNHGALSLGTSIEKAKMNAELLEKSAKIYYMALSTGKEVTVLPGDIKDFLFEILKEEQRKEVQGKEAQKNEAIGNEARTKEAQGKEAQ